jgi:hypothetical protein
MRHSVGFLLALVLAVPAAAQDAGVAFFETKVRPVLVEQCYPCHSHAAKKRRGGLYVDSKIGLLDGGDSGPAIVPGKPAGSLLIRAVRHTAGDLKMPPERKLAPETIADLEKWIALGAPDPRTAVAEPQRGQIDIDAGRQFWAFQPPKRHPVPAVQDNAWPAGPIDRFLLAQMEAKHVRPVADADRPTLIRRTYFALIGLPPTPAQIDAFVDDRSPDAFARVIDELLASPHFGETWGRHWLDLARFSESSGGGRSLLFKEAWRYRDYVVQSFNDDTPYDQFLIEQIAGDLLPYLTLEQRCRFLIATGFLTLGPTNYERQDKPSLEMDVIDEQLDTIGKTMLGMTIGCARCHDHKFDPIPQADYYALAGILRSTKTLIHDNVSRWVEQPLPSKSSDRPMAMSVQDAAKVGDCCIAVRGNVHSKGAVVPRGVLQVPTLGPPPVIPANESGRRQLAGWIASKDNPLTARVMVNRVWHHLFGAGIVRTVDNFGSTGEPPSHPELLDYLALRFVEQGWSVKTLIREVMLSHAYRLASTPSPEATVVDPENRLLWRMNRRRLDAEAIRDTMLQVAGRLNRTIGGPTMKPGTKAERDYVFDDARRSIYTPVFRNRLLELFDVFDFADPNLCLGRRNVSTVATQALYLMNSPFVQAQAHAAAEKALTVPMDDAGRLDIAYRRTLGRLPTVRERELAMDYLRAAPDRIAGWERLYQVLFACVDFRYVN